MFRRFIQSRQSEIIENKVPGIHTKRWHSKIPIILLIYSTISTSFGLYSLFLYLNSFSLRLPYQSSEFTINNKISSKIYFYIEIHFFHQNHNLYKNSINYDQLQGSSSLDLKSCEPLSFIGNRPVYPCGLVADSYLQDKFVLRRNGQKVPIKTKNLVFRSQEIVRPTNFNESEVAKPPSWEALNIDLYEDERFMSWINRNAFSPFRKLYGVIDGLKRGDYSIEIEGDYEYGDKYLYFTEGSFLGNPNVFMAVFLFSVGIFGFVMSIVLPQVVK